MRVLLVAHGYPPRERAGTEQHVAAVAKELAQRGHTVLVVSATRMPGAAQGRILRSPALPGEPATVRIVNNIPARPLASAERDGLMCGLVEREAADFVPDVVHVHHLQFLSSALGFRAPVVYTLHDAWTWCAAGGTLLLRDQSPCPGPQPERCAPCAAAWAPVPGRRAQWLLRAAAVGSRLVPPDRLHRLYQRLPDALRAPIRRDATPPDAATDAARRNAAMASFAASSLLTAPSHWLASKAEAVLQQTVRVVPHGIRAEPLPREPGPDFLFLGTLAGHKGPDRVVQAWRDAFPSGTPGLALHGPISDPSVSLGHPTAGPLDRAGVWRALSRARALVLASRWEENAPLVVLEARAAGCPVIAPRQGGLPELIADGLDGLLYDPDTPGALSQALRDVMDREFRPRPPRALRAQVDDYESLYEQVGA